jgi:hypothetical protein
LRFGCFLPLSPYSSARKVHDSGHDFFRYRSPDVLAVLQRRLPALEPEFSGTAVPAPLCVQSPWQEAETPTCTRRVKVSLR